MKLIDRLEARFGRFAIKNLMLYLTILYVFGFVLHFWQPAFYGTYLCLNMNAIFHGQVWRLITWLMYPPSVSPFFGLILIYMYFMLGSAIEHVYGPFRLNLFLFLGTLIQVLIALVFYLLTGITVIMTPENLNLSIFIAYMLIVPDAVFLLMFIIPIRAKYLGILYAVLTLISFITGNIVIRLEIAGALVNLAVFYFGTIRSNPIRIRRVVRREPASEGGESMKMKPAKKSHHKCDVCGRTELDDPELEFRFCTKCSGNHEYCTEHLYTHIHVEGGSGDE